MKLSVRDLLSWVWQVFLSWLTAITTGIDRPLCLERSKKMVVKANDPEMAVGRTAEEDTMPKEPGGGEGGGVLLREEEVVETLSRSIIVVEGSRTSVEEVNAEGSVATVGEENKSIVEENRAEDVEAQEDEASEDTLSDSSSENSQNSFIEASRSNVQENDTTNGAEAGGDAVNEEENVNNNIAEDLSANNNVADDWGAGFEEENNSDTRRRGHRDDINENDEDDDDYDEEEEEGSNEPDTSTDTNFIWLLELSSREIYQKVLSPQYHCLNFRTISPLEHSSVMTAIKQLRRLIPWLGFGFKRKKNNMWLCLCPEDYVNFQMAQYDESMWDIIFNNRDQFNYMENRSMCSFVLMKAYPCTQCEAVVDTEMPSTCTAMCSPSDATMNTSEANASSTPVASAAPIVNCNSVEINTCKDISTKHCENEVDSVSISSASDITAPAIHTKISSALPSDSTNCAPSANCSDAATRKETTAPPSVPIDAGGDSSTSSTAPEPIAGGNALGKKEFIHNYRLVFGVPHPLADEKSVSMICDVFLKELNTVISEIARVPVGSDKNNLDDASVVVTENQQSERTQDTSSSSSDSQEGCQENVSAVASGDKAGEPAFPDTNNSQVTAVPETTSGQVPMVPDTTTSQVPMVLDAIISQVPTAPVANSIEVPTVPDTTNSQVSIVPDTTSSQVPTVPDTNSIPVPTVPDTTNSLFPTVPDTTNRQVPTVPDTNSIQVPPVADTTNSLVPTVPSTTDSKIPTVPDTNSIKVPTVPDTTSSQVPTNPDINSMQVLVVPDTNSSQVPTVPDTNSSQVPTVPDTNSIQVPTVPDTNGIQVPTVPDTNGIQVPTVPETTISQVECKTTGSDEVLEIIAKKKASVQEQFTVLANIFASVENKDDQKTKETIKNNNVNAVDRNSPHVERKIEVPNTRNFINKCKTERVSFISAFAICVNAAIANTLVKCGMKNENEALKIGHIVSHYYNLDDLTDDDWHDHDPPEDYDEDESEDPRYKVCCKRPTVSLSLIPRDWYHGVWERAHMIDQKRLDAQSESSRKSTTPVIPLNTERNSNGDERFSTVCQPQADLSISNINNLIPRFSRRLDNLESMTIQRLSPVIIFFMTNAISLNFHNNNLRFSFYHQEQFVSNSMAHQYADEIVSAINRTTMA